MRWSFHPSSRWAGWVSYHPPACFLHGYHITSYNIVKRNRLLWSTLPPYCYTSWYAGLGGFSDGDDDGNSARSYGEGSRRAAGHAPGDGAALAAKRPAARLPPRRRQARLARAAGRPGAVH